MAAQTFTISGRPAVRSLAIAAGLSLLGMLVLALSLVTPLGDAAAWIGLVLALAGAGMVVASLVAARRSGVAATLSDDGFEVVSNRTRFALPWREVKHVGMGTNTLVIRDQKGQEASIIAPPGSTPAELDALAAAMAKRLDDSRGYHNLI